MKKHVKLLNVIELQRYIMKTFWLAAFFARPVMFFLRPLYVCVCLKIHENGEETQSLKEKRPI